MISTVIITLPLVGQSSCPERLCETCFPSYANIICQLFKFVKSLIDFFLFLFQYVEGQSIHNLRCIPPMIDFEAKFANTLRLRPQYRKTIEEIKKRRFAPPGCTNFDSAPVDNIWALNVQRCTQGSPIEFTCITTTQKPTTTTSEATTTTTKPETTTTTDSFVFPWHSSSTTEVVGIPSPAAVSPQIPYRTSKPPPYIPPPSPPDTGGGEGHKSSTPTTVHPGDRDTTGAYIPGPGYTGVTGVVPTVLPVASEQSNITTTVISVGAGILALLLIIGLLFLCRYVYFFIYFINMIILYFKTHFDHPSNVTFQMSEWSIQKRTDGPRYIV